MKKTLSLVLALITLLFCLVGCNNSKEIVLTDEDIHTDYAGVYLTLSSVDTSGEHKKLNAVWHNETTKTVTYGNWFVIEKKDGDNWTDVSTADVSFTEEVYIVEPNKTSEKSYTTKFADISKEGTYRVRTEFFVQESDESSKRGTTWIEFEVKPAGNVKSYSVTVEGGDEFLYEDLSRKYKEGEQVIVKTNIILDMSLTVYVNGESIGTGKAIKTGDEYTHWEYYFTMPSEDVTITFEEKDGMLVDQNNWDAGTAWVNYGGNDAFYFGALNRDKFSISSVKHLPIYKFDSLAELNQFKATFADVFSFNESYDEIQSFETAIQKFDDSFFAEYSLFVVYVSSNSGSLRFGVNSVYNDGDNFCVYIEQLNNPENVSDDMAGWFILLPQQKILIEGCESFDAQMGKAE